MVISGGDVVDALFIHRIPGDHILFKHMRGSSYRSGREFHPFYEIIYFLGGEAEFISETQRLRLQPETLIVIPKETYHQMVIYGDQQEYHRCLLQFTTESPVPESVYKDLLDVAVIRGDWEINYLFKKLIDAAGAPAPEASLPQAVLVLLLTSLKAKSEIAVRNTIQNHVVRQAIEHINRNISQPLLLPDIAEACNVSASTLSHIFKKEMNIGLHQFIIKKRLINVHHRIASGQPATAAALECGFHDYSGFYKQYKKAFGFPPSKKQS